MWHICRRLARIQPAIPPTGNISGLVNSEGLLVSLVPGKWLWRVDSAAVLLKRFFRRHARSKQGSGLGRGKGPPNLVEVDGLPDGGKAAGWSSLVRPAVFTLAFGAGSFGAAAVWQYESMREEARRSRSWRSTPQSWLDEQFPSEEFRDWKETVVRRYWTESGKVFACILAANVVVFCMWRVPSLQRFMLRHFASNPGVSNAGAPMLLSAFSHHSFLHLGVNMFVLHSFCEPMVGSLGREQFVGLYLASAVFSSFCSMAAKVALARTGYSLGASGAIYCVLGSFGTLVPDAMMQIVFLPWLTFTSASAIKGLIALDTAGLVAGWRLFDHAGHLGGIIAGVWYCSAGHDLIWEKRGAVMTWWHNHVRRGEK